MVSYIPYKYWFYAISMMHMMFPVVIFVSFSLFGGFSPFCSLCFVVLVPLIFGGFLWVLRLYTGFWGCCVFIFVFDVMILG